MQSDIGFVCNQIWAREEKGIASVLEAAEHQSLDPGLSKDCQVEQDPTTNGDPEMVHPPGRTLLRLKASKGVPQIVHGLNRFQNRRPRMATLTRLGVWAPKSRLVKVCLH